MGIAIHYKGKIEKTEYIKDFVQEMEDISEEMKWKYTIIETEPTKNKPAFQGIILKPHEKSESLSLFFDPEGRLQNLVNLILDEKPDIYSYSPHIKTQFAPFEIHIAIIKLLKYLKSKYISDLEVFDEADYWDTMDEAVLKEKMNLLASKIDLLGDLLDANQENLQKAKTPEGLAKKIEDILKKLGFENE